MNYGPFVFFAIAILAWYVIFVFPQQKKAKERKAVIDAVKAGDEIVTYGGIFAVVKEVEDSWVIVSVADGVDIKVAKEAIVMRRDAGGEDDDKTEKKNTTIKKKAKKNGE